jgi:hypothetical protein
MLPAGEETRTRVMEQLQGAIDDERRRVAEVLATPAEELPPNLFVMPVMYSGRVVENEGRVLEDTEAMFADLACRVTPMEPLDLLTNVFHEGDEEKIVRELADRLEQVFLDPDTDLSPMSLEMFLTLAIHHASPTLSGSLTSLGLESQQAWVTRRHEILSVILGEHLDEAEGRATTTTWLGARLRDGNGVLAPHVVAPFLARAFSHRAQSAAPYGLPLLSPSSMRAALPQVASHLLQEVLSAADPETKRAILALEGQDADQPREKLAAHLKKATGDDRAEARLKDLGFLRITRRHDGTEMVRIVDLYALAPELGVRRVGRR